MRSFLRQRPLAMVIALVASLLSASVAHATSTEAMDLRALVRGADHVVVGTVVSQEAHYDHLDRIVTDVTIRVDERMHGAAGEGTTVVVRRLGGVIGDVGLRIEGEPSFVEGERVVLFARMVAADRVLRPIGMSQGVLPIARDGGVELVMPGGEGLALVQRGSDGRLREAPGALMTPEPVDALLARVRDLVAEIHGAH
ncbi:hypothetical protein [Sandaracinus amylolyticus]|uniref:hypothetical protein n=1 Tax=Sandaracinus amylolyticus TaxID=927083 RepID=UPI001F1F0143|nr:hypothetical protein [Sandaracinus amylolyticus]